MVRSVACTDNIEDISSLYESLNTKQLAVVMLELNAGTGACRRILEIHCCQNDIRCTNLNMNPLQNRQDMYGMYENSIWLTNIITIELVSTSVDSHAVISDYTSHTPNTENYALVHTCIYTQ